MSSTHNITPAPYTVAELHAQLAAKDSEIAQLKAEKEDLQDACDVLQHDLNDAERDKQDAVNAAEVRLEYEQKNYVSRLKADFEFKTARLRAQRSQFNQEIAKVNSRWKKQMHALAKGMGTMSIGKNVGMKNTGETGENENGACETEKKADNDDVGMDVEDSGDEKENK